MGAFQNFGKWLKKINKSGEKSPENSSKLRNWASRGGAADVVLGGQKLAAVALGGVILAPVLGGALTAGKTVGKMGFLSTIGSKIGSIFKKKEGGTVLGNLLRGTVKSAGVAAIEAVGNEVGSTAHGIATDIAASPDPAAASFSKGFKTGFLKDLWAENKGMVIGGIIGLIGLIYLIFFWGKKRRR